jgi:hypothetical protein
METPVSDPIKSTLKLAVRMGDISPQDAAKLDSYARSKKGDSELLFALMERYHNVSAKRVVELRRLLAQESGAATSRHTTSPAEISPPARGGSTAVQRRPASEPARSGPGLAAQQDPASQTLDFCDVQREEQAQSPPRLQPAALAPAPSRAQEPSVSEDLGFASMAPQDEEFTLGGQVAEPEPEEFMLGGQVAPQQEEFMLGGQVAPEQEEFMLGGQVAPEPEEFMLGGQVAEHHEEFSLGGQVAASEREEFLLGGQVAEHHEQFSLGGQVAKHHDELSLGGQVAEDRDPYGEEEFRLDGQTGSTPQAPRTATARFQQAPPSTPSVPQRSLPPPAPPVLEPSSRRQTGAFSRSEPPAPTPVPLPPPRPKDPRATSRHVSGAASAEPVEVFAANSRSRAASASASVSNDSGQAEDPKSKARPPIPAIGGCELRTLLGRGAMGAVWRGYHSGFNQDLAVKLLPAERTSEQRFVDLFIKEARALVRVAHPNVVRIFNVGEEIGQYFIAMELIEGSDFGRMIKDRGKVPPQEAARIIKEAAMGLAAAHKESIVHRDVKPDNLMITRAGVVKVADFGLAIETEPEGSVSFKKRGPVGTPY